MSTLLNPVGLGTMAAGSVLGTLFDVYKKAEAAGSHMKTSSLVNATSVARVEPIVIVDKDCLYLEYLPDILQSTQSIFVGYWLQALSLLTNVGDVNVGRVLDKLNPNRQVDRSAFLEEVIGSISKESFSYSTESYKYRLPGTGLENDESQEDKKPEALGQLADTKLISDLTNLSVGKMINVTIKNNGQSAVIPISFRLMVNTLPSASCVQLLSSGSVDLSFKERWFKWRAGRISFIKDLVFCQDLIREQKRTLMSDKDGVYSEISRRAKNSKLASFFSKNPSLAEASNIIVVSEETAMQLRVKHSLNLASFKDRQRIFDQTYGMILVVIDRNYERINMYHYGIAAGTSVGLRDIKVANKSGGPDILEVLSAFKSGSAPMF